ncbi:MAG: hypothetical protein IT287_09565, partial [Bdellovibrionaceae bacterium]|nr:hypothetical protein [Pseudobdellovibrionaceae bacterium]
MITSILSCFVFFLSAWGQERYSIHPDSAPLVKKFSKSQTKNLSQAQLGVILKDISESDTVQSAQIQIINGQAHFAIEQILKKQKLTINGNQALTETEISSILGTDKITQLSTEVLQRTLPKLKEKYEAIGLRNVDIFVRETSDGESSEFIVDINEGRSAALEDIVVLSQDQSLNSTIRYALSAYRQQKIDKTVLKEIENKITNILVDHRMLGAKISKITPIYNQDRTSAKITVSIETTASYEFIFEGNKYFTSGNIITHFDLEKNYLNYIKNANLLIKDVENLYRENGFANVKVTTENINYEKQKKIVILFNIKEGPQLRIKNIVVTGKITRSPTYYEDLIRENLDETNNANLFIKQSLDKAILRVAIQLKDQGYLKADASPTEYKINADNTVTVLVQVNENMLTQIRNIQFVGIKNFTSNQLHDVIDLKPNSTL